MYLFLAQLEGAPEYTIDAKSFFQTPFLPISLFAIKSNDSVACVLGGAWLFAGCMYRVVERLMQ